MDKAIEPSAVNRGLSGAVSLGSRWIIAVLTVVATLNFIDRQLINILAEAIKKDLGVNDTEIGILTGLSFAALYAVLSLPAARLADRYNRPRLLAGAVALWSMLTAACGLAANFAQLALARMGVGIGESACTPTAHSLIADEVPLNRRASAIAVYSMGIPIGSMIGLAVGGIVVDHFGWRMAFLIMGAPGLIVALLVWLVIPEPRTRLAPSAQAGVPRETLSHCLKLLWAKRSARALAVSTALTGMVQSGAYAFMPSFFMRVHRDELANWAGSLSATLGVTVGPATVIGVSFGVLTGIMAIIGMRFGGAVADRRGGNDLAIMMRLPALMQVLAVGLALATLFSPLLWMALALSLVHSFFQGMGAPVLSTSVLGLVSANSRATAAAIFLIISTLIGLGLGPLIIGIASDAFNTLLGLGPLEGLRYGLASMAVVLLISAALLAIFSRRYRDDFVG